MSHSWQVLLGRLLTLVIAITLLSVDVCANNDVSIDNHTGEVRISLQQYEDIIKKNKESKHPSINYALGNVTLSANVTQLKPLLTVQVKANIVIELYENAWTSIPVLPVGTAIEQALVDGKVVQLNHSDKGLVWNHNVAGHYRMELTYHVNVQRSKAGFLLALPTPFSASTHLNIDLPGSHQDVAIVPANNQQSRTINSSTRISANIPATQAVMISWRSTKERKYSLGRAKYQGELNDNAIYWHAEFFVESFVDEKLTLPVLKTDITLSELHVNGEQGIVIEENGYFSTIIEGQGKHTIHVSFQVPLRERKGPPSITMSIPKIPVSEFELKLPGKKTLKVSPQANVITKEQENYTLSTIYVPMSDNISFSWVEAIPEDLQVQVRSNATLYHTVHAEEGVLHVKGTIVYDITHGKTNTLSLSLPESAQVNRIVAHANEAFDWAISQDKNEENSKDKVDKKINLFLEREVKGTIIFDVYYEQLLTQKNKAEESFSIPLLVADEVHRQRGMIALLAGTELALKPVIEKNIVQVGENQLPALVRNTLSMTIAHTFKYSSLATLLTVKTVAPERKQGKFDAQVDTLISIGEVSMKGSASIEVDIKSGSIMSLTLTLPAKVNILRVTGPSIRNHIVKQHDDNQSVEIEFTQEMEGQLTIDVHYERLMISDKDVSQVPTLIVNNAEVEHGRIAVEALTAVEVKAAKTEQLSNVDINELPRQLILKTSNPILLAYKYVHAKPPYELALKITRHKEIDVKTAVIEKANYQTLFTDNGLAVTTAQYVIRNSRRQFLRLELPENSEVWSVFVDNNAEKPARAEQGKKSSSAILIKMINSASGFPVQIVYASPIHKMEQMGVIQSELPRPDMIVTQTHWDTYLPIDYHYHHEDSSMDVLVRNRWANPKRATTKQAYKSQANAVTQPLRIKVPTQGYYFSFEKLYANQSQENSWIKINYVSEETNLLAIVSSAFATLLIWLGVISVVTKSTRISHKVISVILIVGVALLLVTMGYFGTSPQVATAMSIVIAILFAAYLVFTKINAYLKERKSASV